MSLHELNSAQRRFAEENHNLIYAFLKKKKLPEDDYYDVVAFGFLRAVQNYLCREELRKYDFREIAFHNMKADLQNYLKKQSKRMRNTVTISFDSVIYDDERLTIAEIIPHPAQTLEKVEASILWDEINSLLSDEETEILRLLAAGYTTREIAVRKNRQCREIEDIFGDIRSSVFDRYLA
jgi:RNA polymerase sigma factor (sigma-70 family)